LPNAADIEDDNQEGGDRGDVEAGREDIQGSGSDAEDEISQVPDGTVFTWNSVAHETRRILFVGTPGIQVLIPDANDILAIFQHFVTDEMVENIVVETNQRAMQYQAVPGEININFTKL